MHLISIFYHLLTPMVLLLAFMTTETSPLTITECLILSHCLVVPVTNDLGRRTRLQDTLRSKRCACLTGKHKTRKGHTHRTPRKGIPIKPRKGHPHINHFSKVIFMRSSLYIDRSRLQLINYNPTRASLALHYKRYLHQAPKHAPRPFPPSISPSPSPQIPHARALEITHHTTC
jgi:hypothetical protein